MGIDIGTAVAAAAVSALVNLGAWFLFRRSIERLDADNVQQREELRELRDEKLQEIKIRLDRHEADALQARRNVHERINRSMTQEEFLRRAAGIEASVDSARADIGILRQETAGQGAILKLIAGHMGISFPGGRPA